MHLNLATGVFILKALVALAMPTDQPHKFEDLLAKRGGYNFDYDHDKIKGVNLGGWFVLEPYITPSLFKPWSKPGDDSQVPVDEYHLTQRLGKAAAQTTMEQHWSTWYTEDDFAQIQKAGLNMVRIPIGYWAFHLLDNDPYVQGQVKHLDQALEWCRKHNLRAWIDLHGVPGSQNGFDNSGIRDQIQWQQGNNVQISLDVLQTIFNKYGTRAYGDVVIGIELVNEPFSPFLDVNKIKDFYTTGYDNLRKTGSVTPVVIHDAFLQDTGYWDNFLNNEKDSKYWNVVVDHHYYQVFSGPLLQKDIDDHVQSACAWGAAAGVEYHWTVAGEWSAALTDCALWLNGVGRGARWSGDYDNVQRLGSCAPYTNGNTWSQQHKTNVRRYIEAQLDAFNNKGGWVFWNWKTEDAVDWDLQRLLALGAFPQPLEDRKFPNQCHF